MAHREPPPPPPTTDGRDESPLRRVQANLRYIAYAAATIFATTYCWRLHPLAGLTATFLAKHILVAILAAALRLPMRDVKP